MSEPATAPAVRLIGGEETSANWLWLAELPSCHAALCVAARSAAFVEMLSRHFEVVCAAEPRAWPSARSWARLAEATGRVAALWAAPPRLPFADAAFNCVAIPALFDWWPDTNHVGGNALRLGVLAECRRLLRPGGCCYVATANPLRALTAPQREPTSTVRRLSRLAAGLALAALGRLPAVQGGAAQPPSLHRMASLLRRAGFARIRVFYADPSHHEPQRIIPSTRRASLAFERTIHDQTHSTRVRQVLAAAGLHELLYGSILFLAYA